MCKLKGYANLLIMYKPIIPPRAGDAGAFGFFFSSIRSFIVYDPFNFYDPFHRFLSVIRIVVYFPSISYVS